MRIGSVLVFASLAACASPSDDTALVHVTPETKTASLAYKTWHTDVYIAAQRWTDAGCPIDLWLDASKVIALPFEEWPFDDSAVGMTAGGISYVRGDLPSERRIDVATHELGHMLGVPHRDHGIMLPSGGTGLPTADDCDLAGTSY